MTLPSEQSEPTFPAEPTFAELGVAEPIVEALAEVGYESPTPIQAATIPALLAGRDVIGLAQTGTGKTAAFALPILSGLTVTDRGTQALVLTPTRELALQVAEAIGRYGHHLPGLQVLPIYGGQGYPVQLAGLRRGAQVVVGTPGRIIDHLLKRTLDLSRLRLLVLDEADEMLQLGFQADVETILAETPPDKQVALFSATMPSQIRRISQRYLTDPVEIAIGSQAVPAANIRQRYLFVAGPQKLDALTRILEVESFEAMIVFVRTKQATEDLAERLRARGFAAAAINGDLVQAQRERLIGQLRSGALDLLVATDVAARGLDVDRISHVVNYDIPTDPESYVHRIGRTGRAGRSGEALLFVTPRERHLLAAIEKATRLAQMELPSADEVNATRKARFADSITGGLTAAELPLFRELILAYASEHEVPLADIAAALAVLAQDEATGSFLLEPDPPAERVRDRNRPRGPDRRREHDRSMPRVAGQRKPRPDAPMATYRIGVGRRHRVKPNAIVGAIANEGGLRRQDFGHIDIRADHSLVELPAELPSATLAALQDTRISGRRIELTRQAGPRRTKPRPS
jgi:ATP-dependent RNA helicase DeaD